MCPQAAYTGEIPVSATDTTMLIDLRAGVHTAEGSGAIMVDIVDNVGTVSFGGSGPVAAFLYKRIPWSGVDFVLLAGLAVTDGAWLPFWLYCGSDGALEAFYGERTDGAFTTKQAVAGTCDVALVRWMMPLHVPAHTLRNVSTTCGFTVEAPPGDAPLDLASSRPGVASIDGLAATALVFATVDCRTGCGSGSWLELHSVLWQPSSGETAFAIWYLDGDTSGAGVTAANGLELPAAGWNDIVHQRATWTATR
jgi:hypothetical protein